MGEGISRFQLIVELQELAERAFVHKLKASKPNLSEEEIKAELNRWYKVRPGAELGDGVGRPGNRSRFD